MKKNIFGKILVKGVYFLLICDELYHSRKVPLFIWDFASKKVWRASNSVLKLPNEYCL